MKKFTLVPESFFDKEKTYQILSEAVRLGETDKVYYKELPEQKAVLVYAAESENDLPPVAGLLGALGRIADHNKVAAAVNEGTVSIVLAEGDRLLLANAYPAPDAVTAEYFLFAAMKQFQLNPQITTVYFLGDAPRELLNDLFRHFKGVERL